MLLQAFLYLKWEQIKQIYHFITIFCHLVYSVVYTSYCLLMFVDLCNPSKDVQNAAEIQTKMDQNDEMSDKYESVKCTLNGLDNQAEVYCARVFWIALLLFTLLL